MNLTLSADEELIAKARAYAQAHNTTLNQMLRDYMRRVTGQLDRPQVAAEFAQNARLRPGRSEEGFRFDRESIHKREPGI